MRLIVAISALWLAAGCSAAPPAQQIADPAALDTFCGTQTIEPDAIKSVLSSTTDTPLGEPPNETAVQTQLRHDGGVIAYWNDQLLALPQTAESLGESDGKVRVRALAVPVVPAGATTRVVYLLVRDHGVARWIATHSTDAASVCTAPKG
jgi:hypothetical protein